LFLDRVCIAPAGLEHSKKHRRAVRCLLFSRYGKGLMPTIDIWGSIYRTVVVLDLRAGVVRL